MLSANFHEELALLDTHCQRHLLAAGSCIISFATPPATHASTFSHAHSLSARSLPFTHRPRAVLTRRYPQVPVYRGQGSKEKNHANLEQVIKDVGKHRGISVIIFPEGTRLWHAKPKADTSASTATGERAWARQSDWFLTHHSSARLLHLFFPASFHSFQNDAHRLRHSSPSSESAASRSRTTHKCQSSR